MIIYSNCVENFPVLLENIKLNGYKFIEDLIKENKNVKKINKINILQLSKIINKEYDYESLPISEKLKTLLILAIHQQKFIQKANRAMIMNKNDNNNQLEEVFLINISWLCKIGYNELIKMIEEDKIKKILKSNSLKESELLIKIFEFLDLQILNEIDKNLEKLEIKNEDFFAQKEQIILSESKKINIYDNFIIVEKSIIDLFNNNFLINKDNNIKSFKHISGNKKNILLIDSDSHSYLLFGSIINDENIYKLEYIFDFTNKQNLQKQLDELIKDYNYYFDKIIIFNKNNKYDYISPIYGTSNKNEIGNCYKYDNNLLEKDYSNYILNQDLIKMINLYIYYKSLNSRFQNNNKSKGKKEISSEKYYLVSEEIIKKWKKLYNYDKINEELNSNSENLKIIDKIIFSIYTNNLIKNIFNIY